MASDWSTSIHLPIKPFVQKRAPQLQEKCSALEAEAARRCLKESRERELELQLQGLSTTLTLAKARAGDLAQKSSDQELASQALRMELKVKLVSACLFKANALHLPTNKALGCAKWRTFQNIPRGLFFF